MEKRVKPELDFGIRRSGRSTRIVDAAMQELFEKGYVQIFDHIDKVQCDQMLFDRFLRRLESEHGFQVSQMEFSVDKGMRRVKWLAHPDNLKRKKK